MKGEIIWQKREGRLYGKILNVPGLTHLTLRIEFETPSIAALYAFNPASMRGWIWIHGISAYTDLSEYPIDIRTPEVTIARLQEQANFLYLKVSE